MKSRIIERVKDQGLFSWANAVVRNVQSAGCSTCLHPGRSIVLRHLARETSFLSASIRPRKPPHCPAQAHVGGNSIFTYPAKLRLPSCLSLKPAASRCNRYQQYRRRPHLTAPPRSLNQPEFVLSPLSLKVSMSYLSANNDRPSLPPLKASMSARHLRLS